MSFAFLSSLYNKLHYARKKKNGNAIVRRATVKLPSKIKVIYTNNARFGGFYDQTGFSCKESLIYTYYARNNRVF